MQTARLEIGAQPTDAGAWILRLYVAGQSPRSLRAFANLRRLCESHLAERYEIQVLDLLAEPHLADGDDILVVPTLVRRRPLPLRRVIGDLSDSERVLACLDIQPVRPS